MWRHSRCCEIDDVAGTFHLCVTPGFPPQSWQETAEPTSETAGSSRIEGFSKGIPFPTAGELSVNGQPGR